MKILKDNTLRDVARVELTLINFGGAKLNKTFAMANKDGAFLELFLEALAYAENGKERHNTMSYFIKIGNNSISNKDIKDIDKLIEQLPTTDEEKLIYALKEIKGIIIK